MLPEGVERKTHLGKLFFTLLAHHAINQWRVDTDVVALAELLD
jgi:hypothetical protein